MLSPPLRGRPASGAQPRSPAYRRSTSLGVAAAAAVPARPASMVTLSTGRAVLATPLPRHQYDPSLARALAALEVPSERVPRVLQGRRLYGSGCGSALSSASSSVSPGSSALSADVASLRPRSRVLDATGRLSRSRSGVFGETKERAEVPLTRTLSTVFGGRAVSALREDKSPVAEGRRTAQQRPTSAADGPVVTHTDVTSARTGDLSPVRNRGGGREANGADRVSPRRSGSRARVSSSTSAQPAVTDVRTTSVSGGLTTADGTDGTQGTSPGAARPIDRVATEGDRTTEGGAGQMKSAVTDRLSGKHPAVSEPVATDDGAGGQMRASDGQASKKQKSESTRCSVALPSVVGVTNEVRKEKGQRQDVTSTNIGDKASGREERKTAADSTETELDDIKLNKRENAAEIGDKRYADICLEKQTASKKCTSADKHIATDGASVPKPCHPETARQLNVCSNSRSEAIEKPSVPVEFKATEQGQQSGIEGPQVNLNNDASVRKTDKAKADKNAEKSTDHLSGNEIGQSEQGAEAVVKVRKLKKKKTIKKLSAENDDKAQPRKGDPEKGTQRRPKEKAADGDSVPVTIGKDADITDDINNNRYLEKTLADRNILGKNKSASQQETVRLTDISSLSTSKQAAIPISSQNGPFEVGSEPGSEPKVQKGENTSGAAAQLAVRTPVITVEAPAAPSVCSPEVGRPAGDPVRRRQNSGSESGEKRLLVDSEFREIRHSGRTASHGSRGDPLPEPGEKRMTTRRGSDERRADVRSGQKEGSRKVPVHSKAVKVAETAPSGSCASQNAATSPARALGVASATDCDPARVSVVGAADAARGEEASPRRESDSWDAAARGAAPPTACDPSTPNGPQQPVTTGKAGPAGARDVQNMAVKHRDPAGRKTGPGDKDKTANRNAAVIGERLILGKCSSDVSGSSLFRVAGPHPTPPTDCGQSDPAPAAGKAPDADKSQHMFTPESLQDAIAPSHTAGAPEAGPSNCHNTDQLDTNKQKPIKIAQNAGATKEKVKIVKKKVSPSGKLKPAHLTTVQNVTGLPFPSKNLASLSPFLRADQEKKRSSGDGKPVGVVPKRVASDVTADTPKPSHVTEQLPVKVRKKKTSKASNASKRSEDRWHRPTQETVEQHPDGRVHGDSKPPSGTMLSPAVSYSRSRRKDGTKCKKTSSARLDTKRLKSKSDRSSSSESCSSSEEVSEDEPSSRRKEMRRVREMREREEAEKIEKFRRRGQKAKLKMERLKMEDDPVEYMKIPGNQRFAFMIKQDDWLRKQKQEAKEKEGETSEGDRVPAAAADRVTSLMADGVTSLDGGRRPSADIDASPFDRRLGPLGGPPPKFRQYAVTDFRLLRVLGKGAFGKVMLAKMKDSRNYFAIKCLRKDKIVNDEDVEDALIERKILTLGTNHPYLCHLFCTFQSPSHLFFVLEFLNGGDLNFHLGQMGRFSTELTRFYASELVCGLRFLHKRGIIYRDLKLDNVLLDHEGHVRIADFGMCKMQIFLDRTADAFCGTVDYMAPEVVSGKNYNQSVDWWSFGIMLYEMLVGLTPFIGLDEDELFWAIRTEQPYYPRFLDPTAAEIIKWLLVKEPALRLGSSECPAGGVCSQPFFRRVDWYAVERKQQEPPPFRPTLMTMADCRYFDDDYTELPARLTTIPDDVLKEVRQDRFAGFDYTNPNMTD